ncbi:hypothetical protein BGW39_002911 [Mortierella sp. 14UC]|nr:hypothetical protein BGW39_002911 [Mortierella sp. 14UC]
MEHAEYQNILIESTVNMRCLISAMNNPIATAATTASNGPHSLQDLLEHEALMSANLQHHFEHIQKHSRLQQHQQQQHQQQQQQQQHQQQTAMHYSSLRQEHTMHQQMQHHHNHHNHNHNQQQQQHCIYMEKSLDSLDMGASPAQTLSPSMVQMTCDSKSQLDRAMIPATSTSSMDFSAHRSVSFDRTSSPETPSPISDQGFFDMTTDDETASCCSPMLLPGKMHNHHNSYNRNVSITMEQLNISGSFPSTPATSLKKRRPSRSLTRKLPPALEQIMLFSPNATAALTSSPAAMMSSSSTSLSTIPVLSSPLKQNFRFPSSSSLSSDSEGLEDEDAQMGRNGSFLATSSTFSSCVAGGKNKRERKASKSKHDKPKHPPVRLHAHKWRGIYAPVRCEACQSPLSNEFSVQRHITRAPPTSRCHRLRVYSIMMSETEIETSVRFYPKRAHGKKTVEIDLEYARARYLSE